MARQPRADLTRIADSIGVKVRLFPT